MMSAGRRTSTVTREEAEKLARGGLTPLSLCLWCLGLVVLPTMALAIVLSLMS